ncbi:retrovirus-related pol polyprotein from transposon TNT 1-94 [Tanacetum coccineum]
MAKATSSQAWLWHRRLSHLNFNTINLLLKNDIVTGLLKLKFVKDHLCSSCKLRKAKRKSFTLTHFLRSKDETPAVLIDFLTLVQRGLYAQVRTVRTGKGMEFLNKTLHAYFAKEGIRHETSTALTPEQNGIVERRNRTLVEAARTMLSAAKVPLFFWAEAIATTCFTQNRSLVIPRHEKTPYHIINGRKPSVKFFHIFGSLCYMFRDGENLDKMKEKGDACIFVGYSTQSRAYRVFNKRIRIIVETIHVNFDELPQMASDHVSFDPVPQCSTTVLEQDSLSPDPQSQENVPPAAETVTTSNELDLLFSLMFIELLNGSTQVVTKSSTVHAADAPDKCEHHNTTHSSTTTVVADAPPLNIQTTPQTTNQAPTRVPTITATKNIIQVETNNEYAQVDGDEFINIFSTPVQEQEETSSRHVDSSNMYTFYHNHPSGQCSKVSSIDGKRLLGSWCLDHGYQFMLVLFGYGCVVIQQIWMWAGNIQNMVAYIWEKNLEEVYVNEPDRFVDPCHPDKVYRLKKALYRLKQAPRAWYDELSKFLVSKGFSKGFIDPTLFITKHGEDILLLQIYVDDIIFGSTNPKLSKRSTNPPCGIFINQVKYAQEILKKHGMTSCDSIGTPMATKHLDADLSVKPTEKHITAVKRIFRYLKDTINMGLWYPKDTGFELTTFSDLDHAGCLDSQKNTSYGIQFLGGDKLVSWSSKMQDCTSMSFVKAKYVSLSACGTQVLWLRTQLADYGFHFDKIPMYCDSKVAIAISCNPVQHSRTKHIDVRYHFIKEQVEKGIVELFFLGTE